MKRLLLGLISVVVILLVTVLAVTGGVLGTASGTTWLLGQAQSMAPGVIRVGSSQGHFFGRLELSEVGLSTATTELSVQTVIFDWSPGRLLSGALVVNEFSADVVRYAGQPPEDPPPSEPLQWPIELPAISPPVKVVLSKVALTDVELISAPDAAPLVIDQALLRAHWGDDGIVVETLESSGPSYTLALDGSINPADAYTTLLTNRVSVVTGDGDNTLNFDVNGDIKGDTERLAMQQQLTGSAQLGLKLTLDKPLEQPTWQALLQLQELRGELLNASLPMTLSGEITANGDLEAAAVSGQVLSNSASADLNRLQVLLDVVADAQQQTLQLKRVELRQQERPLHLTVTGQASAQSVDIQGEWSALQWPLATLKPSVSSQRGQLSLQGPLDDYRLEVRADLAAQEIVQGNWTLLGRGDQQQLLLERLDGGLLGGTLGVKGKVAWAPQASWDLDISARTLSLEPWLADPDAIVNVSAVTNGVVNDAGPEASVVLQQLGGRLNGQPLTGRGELLYSPERIRVKQLAINNADAALLADGVIAQQSDLTWRLKVPDLGQLLADAQGRINSQGRVSGARQTPRVVGDIDVSGVQLSTMRIDKIAGEFDVDVQDRRRSRVDIGADAVTVGEQTIEQLALKFDGFMRDHRLTLQAQHPEVALDLAAQGGYRQNWNGQLMRFDLDSAMLGPWQLQRPVALLLGKEQASAQGLCLVRERAELCAQGQWQAASGEANGQFKLAALPLSWLQDHFPEQLTQATGTLSASGELTQLRDLQASMQAALTAGELLLEGATGEVRIPHQGLNLALNAQGKGANVSLQAGLDKSRLQFKAELPDILAVQDSQQAKVSGNFRLDVPDLDILPLLAPEISSIKGNMQAKFDVRGALGQPWIGGSAQLLMPELNMDHLGLALNDTRMDIGVTNNTLTLDGKTSSDGRLNLQGSMLLDGDKGWPLQLSVKGSDFIAIDVPNMTVALSPDLKIQRSSAGLNVRGTVTVPMAEILIRDLPAGSRSASPDIVIVGEHGQIESGGEATTPADIDLTLALGDKVHLHALGLDAFLRGELSLRARPERPLRATGDIRLFDGIFRAYGQRLEIERGLFSFAKSPLDNPGINVRAVRTIGDVQVGVRALGTAKEMIVTTFSSPSMSENDRISYLVTGKPAREGASLSLDRQIAKNLTVGFTVDTDTGDRAFLTRYRLHRTLYTEVTSSARSSALDLYYTVERK